MPAPSSPSPDQAGGHAPRHHRTVLFYGAEAFARFQAARVTVAGLGGVGSHAAVNLARSGVGRLRLIDFDRVTESSLNRSAFAGPADVGRLKTEALAAHLAVVCPDTQVEITTATLDAGNVPAALGAEPGLVVDAIDDVEAKVALIAHCLRAGVRVIASMGAAGKRDASLVRTGDLSGSTVCPLARKVRAGLKRQGIDRGVPAVWSLEKGDAARPGAPGEADCEADGPRAQGRTRPTLASQMTIPGVFGYALAAMALDLLAATAGDRL